MLDTKVFGAELQKQGFHFFSGVPCSFLQNLINYAINECQYIAAANEGDAVASCAGASLGGSKAVFLCQNSGLTNAVSPLTSLNYIFKIPVLGFVSLRGEPGLPDEPQHELMGSITTSMLDLMRISWEYLSPEMPGALTQIHKANRSIENNQAFFFVVKKGVFSEEKLTDPRPQIVANQKKSPKVRADSFPSRLEVLTRLSEQKEANTILLATTGKTGRELYEIQDVPNHFYMVGSMGCISPLALGLALTKKQYPIIAIDGDGALLMRLGAMAANAYYSPPNMLHIVLDNNSYDSTGGQLTVANNIDFINLAASLGYTNVYYAHDAAELKKLVADWQIHQGLTFIYIKIAKGSKENLGRPKVKPFEVKERLMKFIN